MMKKAVLILLAVAIVAASGAAGCKKKKKQEAKPKEEITLATLAKDACDAKKSAKLLGEAHAEFKARLAYVDDGSGKTESEAIDEALTEYHDSSGESNSPDDLKGCKTLTGEITCKNAYDEIAKASLTDPDRVAEIGAAMKISDCGVIVVSLSEDTTGEFTQKAYAGKINGTMQMFFATGASGTGGILPGKAPAANADKNNEPLTGTDRIDQEYFNQNDSGSDGADRLNEEYFNGNGAGGDGVPTETEQPSGAGSAEE
jgi:hypothetical protein